MRMREVIKTLILVSLILVIVAVAGCGGVTPVENPFIKVTSPKEGDVIDGKDGYIQVEWVVNDLRVDCVYVDFACAYYNKDNKGTQIGDWERIGLYIPASDGSFTFGPNIASWIFDTFEAIPDMCQIRVMEAVGNDPEFEWVYDYSGIFTVTFD
ncbi:MAG: hypothetical protein ACTSUX_03040 [Promethearchaeota archaeon]